MTYYNDPAAGGATTDGPGVAGAAQAVAGTALDRATQASATAGDEAARVASTAAEQAKRVGSDAVEQAQNLLEETKHLALRQAETQTSELAAALGRLRDQANALGEGRADDAGPLPRHVRSVAGQLDQLSRRLDSGGLQGAARDLQRFARRRPLAFLAGAAALGFASGRLVRAGRDSSTGTSDEGYDPTSFVPSPTMPLATAGDPTMPAGSMSGYPAADPYQAQAPADPYTETAYVDPYAGQTPQPLRAQPVPPPPARTGAYGEPPLPPQYSEG